MFHWKPYVPVAERRAQALKKMEKLRKKGKVIHPITIEGRTIAASFWGKKWCDHLESFSDYENRLPRGRTYVRNGSVCHLDVTSGEVEALVSGSSLYKVSVRIKTLPNKTWAAIKKKCAGQIGSMLELLQGKFSDQVMAIVTDPGTGLFPHEKEIEYNCSCPDWAHMCKHVAAVFYGIGNRLDHEPELLFTLRGVDPQELVSAELALPIAQGAQEGVIGDDALSGIFGIDLDTDTPPDIPEKAQKKRGGAARRAATGTAPTAKGGTPGKSPERRTGGTAARKTPPKEKKDAPEVAASPEATGLPVPLTGAYVAGLRGKLALSVPEFARALKVSVGSVYRWEGEQGHLRLHGPSRKALLKLAIKAAKKR